MHCVQTEFKISIILEAHVLFWGSGDVHVSDFG